MSPGRFCVEEASDLFLTTSADVLNSADRMEISDGAFVFFTQLTIAATEGVHDESTFEQFENKSGQEACGSPGHDFKYPTVVDDHLPNTFSESALGLQDLVTRSHQRDDSDDCRQIPHQISRQRNLFESVKPNRDGMGISNAVDASDAVVRAFTHRVRSFAVPTVLLLLAC
jgi:hypothetical protein